MQLFLESLSKWLVFIAIGLYMGSLLYLWLYYKESSVFLREIFRTRMIAIAQYGLIVAISSAIVKAFSMAL